MPPQQPLTKTEFALQALRERIASGAFVPGQRLRVGERNAAWHWAIYEVTGWDHLTTFIRRLWDSFPWRTLRTMPSRAALRVEEHEAVMQAVRRRDAEAAAAAMQRHIGAGFDALLE